MLYGCVVREEIQSNSFLCITKYRLNVKSDKCCLGYRGIEKFARGQPEAVLRYRKKD